jgi:hypothetical protein
MGGFFPMGAMIFLAVFMGTKKDVFILIKLGPSFPNHVFDQKKNTAH